MNGLGWLPEQQGFYRALLDAVPAPIFVVDDDVCIHDFNTAGAALVDKGAKLAYRRRAGEVLHCLHATETLDGCGRAPCCQDCVVRNAVNRVIAGQRVVRQRTQLELVSDGTVSEIYVLVTATQVPVFGPSLVLLMPMQVLPRVVHDAE